jgi:LacI family transcriptional regulator
MLRSSKPKLGDVAARARVSPATVSRALSNPGLLRPDTLNRIRAVIAELGYVRDGAARALVSRRTSTVGVVVPTLDHAIFGRAIQAMQTTFAEAGFQLLVASHEYSPLVEGVAVRAFLETGVDAMLLVGTDHSADVLAIVNRSAVPVVLIWSLHEEFHSVGFDNVAAGRIAAEHLLGHGHRRFGVVSGILRNNDRARGRLYGVRQALKKAGLSLPNSAVQEYPFGLAGGRSGMASLLALAEPPTAVIGGNDLMAIGAMLEIQSRGLKVPADISVAGIDDLDIAAHMLPGLTTVRLPTAELGQVAAQQVLKRFAGEKIDRRIELPIELVMRGSTAQERRDA